ncbi:hypothetical protein ACFQ3R_09745 [Mesonia ostreae]|uniref:LPS export ABC transporter periplasmic protein LptC n=1 Tax=Mesonia ostreae TaxID=861110 RepID=A0ABU2KEB7_9FLAO|nr:hypothetical protein [Mesonia ostreae]MDT0293052.1 hypothetical protein [Mesonia ostreae]
MRIKIKNLILICLIILGFFSCQPALKLFLGIKNPQLFLSNEERMEYYQPFAEKTDALIVYSLRDNLALTKAAESYTTYPLIYAKNKKNDSIYKLNCFEDISWDVENINKKEYSNLVTAKKDSLNIIIQMIEANSKLVYQPDTSRLNDTLMWDIYMVSGTFLGNKLRKRMLPVADINSIHSFNILDISLDK